MRIFLIGAGAGIGEYLSVRAAIIIRKADLLLGSPRLVEQINSRMKEGAVRKAMTSPREIMEELVRFQGEVAVVMYSGDTGFYSGARHLTKSLEKAGMTYELVPGVSSVQLFAARLGRPWQNWKLCSAHGRILDPAADMEEGKPVFFLTGGKLGPAEICRQLTGAGMGDLTAVIGERLGMPEEMLYSGTVREMQEAETDSLSVLLVDPGEAQPVRHWLPGIPDSRFIRGNVPMTKRDIRASILARLQIRPGETVWDIGAGTGSVSVELAIAARPGRVFAVEEKQEACALIRENREKFGVRNLEITEGRAPETLENLPKPDAVFIGGSGGSLTEILECTRRVNPEARICVSAIVLENAARAGEQMEALGWKTEVSQIMTASSRNAGGKHMMLGGNPVWLITGGCDA